MKKSQSYDDFLTNDFKKLKQFSYYDEEKYRGGFKVDFILFRMK